MWPGVLGVPSQALDLFADLQLMTVATKEITVNRIVSVSSMAFDGYPLETALDELAALGVTHVEPASVDKVFQHLV
ncbi:MAG TPA: hypothetical protein VN203_11730, partial [Candidatus Acidoferrum sp.]|nr:hypothetical protein [Candidatus Acidoferrum sp.]